MSKSGLWPRKQPRPTESNKKINACDVLSRQLPSNRTACQSLSVRTDKGSEDEGDFVIAIPDRGFFALEVKGGLIEHFDGRWHQSCKSMDRAPRDQAHPFVKKNPVIFFQT